MKAIRKKRFKERRKVSGGEIILSGARRGLEKSILLYFCEFSFSFFDVKIKGNEEKRPLMIL